MLISHSVIMAWYGYPLRRHHSRWVNQCRDCSYTEPSPCVTYIHSILSCDLLKMYKQFNQQKHAADL